MARTWQEHGLLKAYRCNERSEYIFEPPGEEAPVVSRGRKLSKRRQFSKVHVRKCKGDVV